MLLSCLWPCLAGIFSPHTFNESGGGGVFLPLQHVDIAALLIKYNTCVNATDKWAFTPLHEAAQKGRTQLCALLLAHGADPTMKNQEGQTPLDLATVNGLHYLNVHRDFSKATMISSEMPTCMNITEESSLKKRVEDSCNLQIVILKAEVELAWGEWGKCVIIGA